MKNHTGERVLKFLFLEPFYGGSHKDFADGLTAHSRHQIVLETLPARFWKWRMRGAALKFAQQVEHMAGFDGLITTDLMSLSDLKALGGAGFPPTLVYFHESQLSYPLAPGEKMDYQFGFTDMTTALAADRVLFNSRSHHDAFFEKLPEFIQMMPDFRPTWILDSIRSKSGVRHPGCHFDADPENIDFPAGSKNKVPLVIWNHRWEFDKNPDDFFRALEAIDRRGIEFELAVMGENFQAQPKVFNSARKRLAHRIRQFGYVASRESYQNWLKQGSIVVSTACQENFGIAVIEAMRFGCLPLLPDRLVYPEILPARFHSAYLYQGLDELTAKLESLLKSHRQHTEDRCQLSADMGQYAWSACIDAFDAELENLVRSTQQK
jgi:glycosyltransferase involved in cell wall biosynthesis